MRTGIECRRKGSGDKVAEGCEKIKKKHTEGSVETRERVEKEGCNP